MPLDKHLTTAGFEFAWARHGARHNAPPFARFVAGRHGDLGGDSRGMLADDKNFLRQRLHQRLLKHGCVGIGNGFLFPIYGRFAHIRKCEAGALGTIGGSRK